MSNTGGNQAKLLLPTRITPGLPEGFKPGAGLKNLSAPVVRSSTNYKEKSEFGKHRFSSATLLNPKPQSPNIDCNRSAISNSERQEATVERRSSCFDGHDGLTHGGDNGDGEGDDDDGRSEITRAMNPAWV